MLTTLLDRFRPTEAERIERTKLRLFEKYPPDRDSIWTIVGARGAELATFSGLYEDVLKWAFAAPGFFEHGKAGSVLSLLDDFSSRHLPHETDLPFTRLAMRISNGA